MLLSYMVATTALVSGALLGAAIGMAKTSGDKED
jgi:hypothetical protein